MASLKIVFDGEEVISTINRKTVDEVELQWFLSLLDKHFVTTEQANKIKVYKGARKIRDCFLETNSFDLLFNEWINDKRNRR